MLKSIKVLIFLMVIGIKGLVQGSCLEYGHSCWGAHGKRSGKLITNIVPNSLNGIKYANQLPNAPLLTADYPTKPAHKYILLNILLDKNELDNLEVIESDIPNLSGTITNNEIINNRPPKFESAINWNKNKFKTPIQKRKFLRSAANQIIDYDDIKQKQFDPYNFFMRSAKSISSDAAATKSANMETKQQMDDPYLPDDDQQSNNIQPEFGGI